jgi:hypothetical protein
MPALLEWVWHNDPEGLPDSDHARCIAATGERSLVYGAHLFKLTTVPSISPTAPDSRGKAMSFSTLRLTYAGIGWAQGSATGFWSSDPFDNARHGRDARQTAGIALLATVAGVISPSSP